MDSCPSVSIIMPVYKTKEEFLRKSIESTLNQTFEDFEFIIINSSGEETEDIIFSYIDDNRIKYISQAPSGQSTARNTGLKVSKGKYVFYLDADDWIDNTTLEKLFNKSEAEKYDILMANAYYYDDKTKQTKSWMVDMSLFLEENKTYNINEPNLLNNLFLVSGTPWAKLFKREFLIENDLYFINNIIFEDIEIFFRYITIAKNIGMIKDHIYYYRNNIEESSTATYDKRHFTIIKALELAEESLKKANIYEQIKHKFLDHKFLMLHKRFEGFDSDLKKEFEKLIIQEVQKLNKRDVQSMETKEGFLEFCNSIGASIT